MRRRIKKGQIKMMESMFTLVIFAFLIGFGMFFYFVFAKGEASVKKIELEEQKIVEVALLVSQLPELQCSEGNVEGGACIDLYKAAALAAWSDNPEFRLHYYDIFTFAEISLVPLYPTTLDVGDLEDVFTQARGSPLPPDSIYEFEQNPVVKIYSGKPSPQEGESLNTRMVMFPVTIKDASKSPEQYFMGVLEVAVFSINRRASAQ